MVFSYASKLFILVGPFSTSSPGTPSSPSEASSSTTTASPWTLWETTGIQLVAVTSFWWFVDWSWLALVCTPASRLPCAASCGRRCGAESYWWNFSFSRRWCHCSIIWCWPFTNVEKYHLLDQWHNTETITTVCHKTFARPSMIFVSQTIMRYGLTDCQINNKEGI